MDITILSENDNWYWLLNNGVHELIRSQVFTQFTSVRRNAELFRIGSSNPLIIHSRDELNFIKNTDDDYRCIFLISHVNSQWVIEIMNPPNLLLTHNATHTSNDSAEAYISSLSDDVFESAKITNGSGGFLHPLQHSHRYREMFGIDAEHPSAK
ncbi:hypothetical protein GTGU_04097 [Trabulsiella guamensis ATCC 49490]|uniref:Uncharacterized protein n=1 Tax=Trabulsiella guamensis ATCC 49490 TaxID=1005994 RepID=A0A084ZQB4_9ENTR|nr:hypothetical protein [Trabulsiella guamensis]KFB99658.1 hypothetical protein GTGU_04097 [Trabulsiella guamensis ATCC 49490]